MLAKKLREAHSDASEHPDETPSAPKFPRVLDQTQRPHDAILSVGVVQSLLLLRTNDVIKFGKLRVPIPVSHVRWVLLPCLM